MRLTTSSLRAALLASIAASFVVAPQAGHAQATAAAAAEDAEDNVIIVTASKRTTTLQDTPISVSVTSAASIEQSQVRDIQDLATLVPSLRVSQNQASTATTFIIRGFGNGANNPGVEPSVGVFIDGVYRSRSASQISDLPNIERVEVLRGPQSTLFGKNASAGIISVITAEPQFEFGGNAEFSYGNFNATVAKAAITGPLGDKFAFSLAGNFNKRDGYGRDLNLGNRVSERDRWGVRGQLLFKPNDDFKVRIIADYDKIDENCCLVSNIVWNTTQGLRPGAAINALGGRVAVADPFSYNAFTNFDSINKIDNYGISGQVDWNLNDTLSLTAIGAYRAARIETNADSDFTSADLIGSNFNNTDIDTFTGEVRLASSYDGFFNFLIGGFYLNEDIKVDSGLTYGRDFRAYANLITGNGYTTLERLGLAPAGSFGAQGQGRTENYDYNNESYSIFGQADFEFTDGLVFTAGANYTRDRKSVIQRNATTDVFSQIDLVATGILLGVPAQFANTAANPLLGLRGLQFLPIPLNFPNAVEDGKTSDQDLSYTLRLAYKIDDRFNVYGTYATGFKASSWNLSTDSRPFARDFIPGSSAQVPPPAASPIRSAGLAVTNLSTGTRFAEPEDAEVFEIGVKGQLAGFSFNLAAFRQILKNFQGNFFVGTGFVLTNAAQTSVNGFELETSFTPVRNFNVTFALTYLDPIYDSFTNAPPLDPVTLTNVPRDLSGRRPAGIPEFSLNVGGTYKHEFSETLNAVFHADYNYESPTQLSDGLPTFKREVQSLNSSVTLGIGRGLEVGVWGRNITNAQYLTTIFPSVAQGGSLSGYPSQPRTFGGIVRYRF